MSARESTWVDAAHIILSDSQSYWMTAPELIREIQRRDIRHINNYSQAVRTLRAALNINSKKTHSLFLRSEGDSNVSFALRERLNSVPNPPKPMPTQTQKRKRVSARDLQRCVQPMTNGLPQRSPPATPPLPGPPSATISVPVSKSLATACASIAQSPPTTAMPTPTSLPILHLGHSQPTTTVEIDPSFKSPRTHRLGSESDISSCLCLPSPLSSILGPKRTLQVLNESTIPTSLRPVRQVRKRKGSTKESSEEIPLSPVLNGYSIEGPLLPTPKVLQVEAYHALPSYLSDVVCMSSSYDSASSSTEDKSMFEDPCLAQGKRSHSAIFELDPKCPRKKRAKTVYTTESFGSTSTSQVSSSDSESEMSDCQYQPRPSSRLLMSRRLSQQRRQSNIDYSQLSESMGEGGSSQGEDEGDDVDVEYVGPPVPTCYPRASRVGAKKRQVGSRAAAEEGRKHVEQKRNIASLFQPQSPLVSENMKSLLNMSAFTGLSETQRAQLVKLLPAVDRVGPSAIRSDSLSNSFYSSALREWLEQVAMGTFTTEYRVKVRAEEKKRASMRTDNSWKAKFFEENWGSRIDEPSDEPPDRAQSPTPYYPHNALSPKASSCFQRILKSYSGKDSSTQPASQATPPSVSTTQSPSTTSLPSHTPTITPPVSTTATRHSSAANPSRAQTKQKNQSPRTTTTSKKPTKAATSPKKATPTKTTPTKAATQVQKKNHVAKKATPKLMIPSLLSKAGKASYRKSSSKVQLVMAKNSIDKLRVDKLKTSKIIEQLRLNSQHSFSAQYLTRLPPRTPYQSLLLTLSQASKSGGSNPTPSPPQHHDPAPSTTTTTTTHTHSVYHDHFALLSNHHIPLEFSPPITSLSLQFPLDAYTSCMCARVAKAEHSYAKAPSDSPLSKPSGNEGEVEVNAKEESKRLNLKLSLPRSLLQTNDVCGCDKGALVICSKCKCLYHNMCAQSTLCTTCITLQSLNLS